MAASERLARALDIQALRDGGLLTVPAIESAESRMEALN